MDKKKRFELIFLSLFIIVGVLGLTSATTNPGTYTSSSNQLSLGTWSETYGLNNSVPQQGYPGAQLSAFSSPSGQWSLTGLVGGIPVPISSNYSTQYTGGTFTLLSGPWGDGFTLTGINAIVIATLNPNGSILSSTLTFNTDYNGFIISASGIVSETNRNAIGHSGTVNIESLNIIDTQAPSISNVHIQPLHPNLASTLVQVFATFTDNNQVNHANLYYTIAGDPTLYTGIFNGPFSGGYATIGIGSPKDGTVVSYYVNATDNSGNVALSSVSTFVYDGIPPVTTLTTGTPLFGVNYITSATQITLTATDSESGVANTDYKIDNGNFNQIIAPFYFYLTGLSDGTHTIYYYSTDNAGNVEQTNSKTFILDNTAPITTDNSASYSEWQNNVVTITLTPTDSGSGVANTYYCVDTTGTCNPTTSGTVATITCAAGTVCPQQFVNYYSVDNVGNKEATKTSGKIMIDEQAPITTDNSASYSEWQNNVVTITLTPTDSGSGVANTYYCVDTTGTCNPTTSGTVATITCAAGTVCPQQFVNYYSVDNVGNKEATKTSGKIMIDEQAPITSLGISPIQYVNGTVTFISSSTQLTLTCSDGSGSVSGCIKTYYNISKGFLSYGSIPITISGTDGNYTLQYYSTDNAGNIELDNSKNLTLDNTAPVTTDNSSLYTTWQNHTVTVGLTPTDSGSGVANTYYCVDTTGTCNPTTSGTVATITCAAGTVCPQQFVNYYSVDNVGNKEATKTSGKIMIDEQAPALIITSNSTTDNMDYFTIISNSTDSGSGVSQVNLALINSAGAVVDTGLMSSVPSTTNYNYLLPMWNLSTGTYTLSVNSTDYAGNMYSTVNTFTVQNNLAPTQITAINNVVSTTTGGIVSFTFNMVSRNSSGQVRFGMDNIAGDTPNTLNAVISNGTTNATVGDSAFVGSQLLTMNNLQTIAPGVVSGTFTLYLTLPVNMTVGTYPVNYYINNV